MYIVDTLNKMSLFIFAIYSLHFFESVISLFGKFASSEGLDYRKLPISRPTVPEPRLAPRPMEPDAGDGSQRREVGW